MNRLFYLFLFFPFSLGAATEPLLTFTEAIEQILKRSITVGQQTNNVELVISRNYKDRFSLLPTLNLRGTQGKNQYYGSPQDYSRSLSAELDLNVFKFGADAAAMRAASAEEETERLRVQAATLITEQEAVSALVEVIRGEKTVEVLAHIAEIRNQLLELADERYQRGLLANQEVQKLSVDRDNAEARSKDAEIQLVQSRAALSALLGHDRIQSDWPWKDRYQEAGGRQPEKRTPDLAQRPDWKAAARALQAVEQREKQSWGQVFPSLDLNFNVGHVDDFSYQTSGETWSGMLTLTVPLFDRLANYGAYREQVYARANADLEWERVKRNARSQWQSLDVNLRTSIESARVRERTIRTSEKLYEDNLQRFQQGRVSANDLELDQDRLYDSELLAIQGWTAVHLIFSQWCHAQGLRVQACSSPTP